MPNLIDDIIDNVRRKRDLANAQTIEARMAEQADEIAQLRATLSGREDDYATRLRDDMTRALERCGPLERVESRTEIEIDNLELFDSLHLFADHIRRHTRLYCEAAWMPPNILKHGQKGLGVLTIYPKSHVSDDQLNYFRTIVSETEQERYVPRPSDFDTLTSQAAIRQVIDEYKAFGYDVTIYPNYRGHRRYDIRITKNKRRDC